MSSPRIVAGYPQIRLDELLPRAYAPAPLKAVPWEPRLLRRTGSVSAGSSQKTTEILEVASAMPLASPCGSIRIARLDRHKIVVIAAAMQAE